MKNSVLLPILLLMIISCSTGNDDPDMGIPSDAVYVGVVGNTHQLELDTEIEANLANRAGAGEVFIFQNRTKENAEVTFYLKNYDGEEVNYSYILPVGGLQYVVVQTIMGTSEVVVNHGMILETDNQFHFREKLVYKNDGVTTIEIGEENSISTTSMGIFNPVEMGPTVKTEFTAGLRNFLPPDYCYPANGRGSSNTNDWCIISGVA